VAASSSGAPRLDLWRAHWQDEGDTAFLYRILAARERNAERADLFSRMAEVEEKHLVLWSELLAEHGAPPGVHRPSVRARALAFIGRRFGAKSLLPYLINEEVRDLKGYMSEYRVLPQGKASDASLTLAREEAEHAGRLSEISGASGEPWHRAGAGGFLRNVVYGFNDGLTANFGLVMGVIGADAPANVVLISGIAGLIADSLSMGSSGYLAAKSEREVHEHEIEIEREEIRLMPEVEEEELALLYEAKSVPREAARAAAAQVMAEPERALREMAREELWISDDPGSPMREAWLTGVATAFGALIPILPFFFWDHSAALVASFGISMASHFGVGAARSFFTGRGVFRSGLDMFLVGLGVAVVGYAVGELVSKLL